MAPEQRSGRGNRSVKSVVVVDFPGGREFRWLAPGAPMACWQVGDTVVFKNASWRVTGRTHDSDSLNLTLAPLP
jgi:hypothetical protein